MSGLAVGAYYAWSAEYRRERLLSFTDPFAKMSDEDYMELYKFCKTALKTNKFAGYSEDVCDGQTYMFMYYDEDGNEQLIYDGYCYDNDELDSIVDLVTGYTIEECPVE